MSLLHAQLCHPLHRTVVAPCHRPQRQTCAVSRQCRRLNCRWRSSSRQRASVTVRASNDNNGDRNGEDDNAPSTSAAGIPAGLFLFVGSLAYTLTNMREELTDVLYNDNTLGDLGIAGLGIGDAGAALLWAVALWYVSPLQMLLVFLGKFETDRPSDWIISRLGKAANLDVEAIDYVAPLWTRAAAAVTCLAGGISIAVLLEYSLGDPTWAVSSGIGALFAAAVFEVGRPKRLTVAEAQQLESQWQDFAAFAERRLLRTGRCHESEVYAAFRQTSGKYRSQDNLSDSTLRDMVRNWHPGIERTRTGYLKNVSLRRIGVNNVSSSSVVSSSQQQQQQQGDAAATDSLLENIVAQQQGEQQQQEQQQNEQRQKVTAVSSTEQ